jgi:dihydroflavonol-4-reductase
MPGTVFVSGGSGYIAGFLIRQLAAEGWMVHTTIRDLAREGTVRKLLAVDAARLKVFVADLLSDAGWAEAMAGCSHAAHVASPVPMRRVRDPDEVIVPARDGALRALRAAKAAGVKRFVMTSSVAAIAYGRGRGVHHFTEADWTPPDFPGAQPYVRSKTIAERTARDWVAKEGGGMEYCSINPSVVWGPVWSSDYSASVSVLQNLLNGKLSAIPDIGFGVVDVRDIADLHVRALKAPGMAGERFLASGPFLKIGAIADILRARLGADARKVATRSMPDIVVRIASLFNPMAKAVVGELGSVRNMDCSHAKTVLGWVPRPVEETIVDCSRSLIDQGIVKL